MATLQAALRAYCRRANLPPPTNADEAARLASNMTNNKGQTPLMYACYADCAEAAKELLQHGADPWVADRCGCRNALHYASMSGSVACIDVLMKVPLLPQLVRQGVRYVNSRSLSGLTALHYATFYERQRAVEELLRHEPNINAASTGESYDVWITYDTLSTPLHFAAYRDSTETARLLLVHYAQYRRTGTILDPRQRSNSAGKLPWQVTRNRTLAAMLHPGVALREVLGAEVMDRLEGPDGLGPLSLATIAGAALRQKLLHSVEVIEKECVEVAAMDRQTSVQRSNMLLCGTPRRPTATNPLAGCGSVQRDMFRLASYRLNRPSATSQLPSAPRRAPTLDRLDGPLPHPPDEDEGYLDLQAHLQHAQSVGQSLYGVGSRSTALKAGTSGAVGGRPSMNGLGGRSSRARRPLSTARSRGLGNGGGAGAAALSSGGGGAAGPGMSGCSNLVQADGGTGSGYVEAAGAYPGARGAYHRTGSIPLGGSPVYGYAPSGGGAADPPAAPLAAAGSVTGGLGATMAAAGGIRAGDVAGSSGGSPPGSQYNCAFIGGSPPRGPFTGGLLAYTPPPRATTPVPALGTPAGDAAFATAHRSSGGGAAGAAFAGGPLGSPGGPSHLVAGDSPVGTATLVTVAGDSPRSASPGVTGTGLSAQWPFLGAGPTPRPPWQPNRPPLPPLGAPGSPGLPTPFAALADQPYRHLSSTTNNANHVAGSNAARGTNPGTAGGGGSVLSAAASLVAGSVVYGTDVEGPEGDSGPVNGGTPPSGMIAVAAAGAAATIATTVGGSDDDDENTCNVCFARPEAVAAAGCRHGLCAACAGELCRHMATKPLLCPFCRRPVTDFVRVVPLPPRRVWGG